MMHFCCVAKIKNMQSVCKRARHRQIAVFQTFNTLLSSVLLYRLKTMKMKRTLLLIAAALAMGACRSESFLDTGGRDDDLDVEPGHGMIVLGRQLDDPYSVSNVTKALASLYPVKASTYEVPTTDLYVRFLPKTQEEQDVLDSLGLELLDHPVDYEIVRDGDYYHDPQIPSQRITWQYAVVEPDFEFPAGIRYEILDRCYITEHDLATRSAGIDWAAVERESFRLTGNSAMLEPATRGSSKPSGRITLIDDRYPDSPEGVKGVRVACNVFVKISQAYTDADGYYSLGKSFSAKPRYRLVFKNRKGFGIGLNTILVGGSMSTLGKHSPSGYDCEVSSKSDRALFTRCVVNNTVYDYFNGCKNPSGSIKAPPGNLRIWIFRNLTYSSAVMMQHGAGVDKTKIGEFLGEYAGIVKWFLPDITLGLKNSTDYASVYAHTIHELAHSSHFMQVGLEYWDKYVEFIFNSFVASGFISYGSGSEPYAGHCEVGEMWAYFLQTKLFRERYPDSDDAFGTSFWFYPQIFHYLDERGLGRFKLFQALQPAITDRDLLRDKLLALYPEFKTNIMMAFNRYY